MKCIVFTNFRRQNGNTLITPPQLTQQQVQWQQQLHPYRDCQNVDLIYIFIIEGYQALLSGQIPFKALTIERSMREILEAAARAERIGGKVQIVGIEELVPTLAYFQDIAQDSDQPLNNLLLGGGQSTYYDSPKMIEAFIRLARGLHSETEEVILRVDEDVTVNPKGIDALIDYCGKLSYGNEQDEYCFLSGNYCCHDPEDLLNDYAVRTHHFASVGTNKFNPRDHNYKIAKRWLDSIAEIGADPYNQVISGAGLNMSPQSVMMLPPFANAGSPIIWIDDHLKRLLHEALGHFNPLEQLSSPKDVSSYRCCGDASFEQDRYDDNIQQGDIDWAVTQYFPRLVRGIVMDNLIWDRRSNQAGVYTGFVAGVISGQKVPGEKALGAHLVGKANCVLDDICKRWSDSVYEGYPLYYYGDKLLPDQKANLIDEVVDTFHCYLQLLRIWPGFALLWRHMLPSNRQNDWLYR